MAPIKFSSVMILSPAGKPRSLREKELENSQIRAHAAKVSYQRRNLAKSQVKRQRKEAHGQTRDRSPEEGGFCLLSHQVAPLNMEFHGSSDPFDAFPIKVSPGKLSSGR
jgi:hypothetical protein